MQAKLNLVLKVRSDLESPEVERVIFPGEA